jgi:hypothetical protein
MLNVGQTMLEQTRARTETNRALLRTTRYRIASSCCVLNPFFGLSGGAAPPLRVRYSPTAS